MYVAVKALLREPYAWSHVKPKDRLLQILHNVSRISRNNVKIYISTFMFILWLKDILRSSSGNLRFNHTPTTGCLEDQDCSNVQGQRPLSDLVEVVQVRDSEISLSQADLA